MSDTSQVAFTVDEGAANAVAHSQPQTDFAGAEAPRAIQEQAARQAAMQQAAQQATGQHPQQAFNQEELLNRIRGEVKDQYFTQMEEMKNELATLRQEREAKENAEREAQEAAAAAQRAAEEEKMGAKAYAEAKTAELQQQIQQMREESQRSQLLLAKEREFAVIQQRRSELLSTPEAQNIMPGFRDLVRGDTIEELESSFNDLIQRSNQTVAEIQAELAAQRQQAPGVSTRAPGALSSPTEMAGQPRQFSNEEIAAMSPAEYAKYRPQFLQVKPPGW